MAVSRQARKAIKQGWLVNQELRKGYPADYALGEPMSEEDGLPTSDQISGNAVTNHNNQDVTPPSLKKQDRNAITPITDNSVPPPVLPDRTPSTADSQSDDTTLDNSIRSDEQLATDDDEVEKVSEEGKQEIDDLF